MAPEKKDLGFRFTKSVKRNPRSFLLICLVAALTFTYSGTHITSVTDPLGRGVRYSYDGAGNLTDVTDVNGGNTHFTYDSERRMLTMRFPNQAPGVPAATGAVGGSTGPEGCEISRVRKGFLPVICGGDRAGPDVPAQQPPWSAGRGVLASSLPVVSYGAPSRTAALGRDSWGRS